MRISGDGWVEVRMGSEGWGWVGRGRRGGEGWRWIGRGEYGRRGVEVSV